MKPKKSKRCTLDFEFAEKDFKHLQFLAKQEGLTVEEYIKEWIEAICDADKIPGTDTYYKE